MVHLYRDTDTAREIEFVYCIWSSPFCKLFMLQYVMIEYKKYKNMFHQQIILALQTKTH